MGTGQIDFGLGSVLDHAAAPCHFVQVPLFLSKNGASNKRDGFEILQYFLI